MTKVAVRSTAEDIQAEPSLMFAAWQALVDGHAPKSANDPAIALHHPKALPKSFKDARQLKKNPRPRR